MTFNLSKDAKMTILATIFVLIVGLGCLAGGIMAVYNDGDDNKLNHEYDLPPSASIPSHDNKKDKSSYSSGSSYMSYNSAHTFSQKGEKGERGPPGKTVRGPMGPPGSPGRPGPPGLSCTESCSKSRSDFTEKSSWLKENRAFSGNMACSWLITNERHVSQQRPASDCVFAFLEDRQKLLLGFSNRWFSLPITEEHPLTTKDNNVLDNTINTISNTVYTAPPPPPPPRPPQNINKVPPMNKRLPLKKIRLVATNVKRTGSLGGPTGADRQCQRDAELSSIAGKFRAFLPPFSFRKSKSIHGASYHEEDNVPILNLKGEVLFHSWASMIQDGGIIATRNKIYNFNKVDITSSSTNIWHGINPWGEPSHFDCEDWNSEDPLHVGLTSDPSVGILSHQKKMSCNNRFHILCIETT